MPYTQSTQTLKCVGNVKAWRDACPTGCPMAYCSCPKGSRREGNTPQAPRHTDAKLHGHTDKGEKIVLYAAENGCTIWDAADALGFDPEGTRKAVTDFDAAMHRPRKSKPSAETLKNAAIMHELVDELNARGKEMTAAELADVYTDPEGNVLNPRKVGSALARAAREGLIAKSPEKWSVAHYAPQAQAGEEVRADREHARGRDRGLTDSPHASGGIFLPQELA